MSRSGDGYRSAVKLDPAITANAAAGQAVTDGRASILAWQFLREQRYIDYYRADVAHLGADWTAVEKVAKGDATATGLLSTAKAQAAAWDSTYGIPAVSGTLINNDNAYDAFLAFQRTNASLDARLRTLRANSLNAAADDRTASYAAVAVLALLGVAMTGLAARDRTSITGGRVAARPGIAPARSRPVGVGPAASGPADGLAGADAVRSPAGPTDAERAKEREALEQVRRFTRERDAFVETVSYKLGAPLTNIVGYLELLASDHSGPLNPPQRETVMTVARQAAWLQGLIFDMRAWARIQAGTFELEVADHTLGPVVDAVWSTIAPEATAAGMRMIRRRDGDAVPVQVDLVHVGRVVANLLTNAVQFTQAGGSVTLGTRQVDDELLIEVSDTGVGIPADEQATVFNRFTRGSSARSTSVAGTGIGLSLVAAIVQKHGGRVGLVSAEGLGTTVTVRLPVAT